MATDEHPISAKIMQFKNESDPSKNKETDQYLIIGVVKGMTLYPKRTFQEAMIYAFKLVDKGESIIFIHKTELDDIPYSLQEWKGKLLVGVGHTLRAYEMGIKKFLKKAELKELNSPVTNI
jgi:splicing factor 3B subunit 3